MDRRQFLTRSGLGVMAAAGTCLGFQGDNPGGGLGSFEAIPDGSASRGMITTKAEETIRRGLTYLNQRSEMGSFGTMAYRGNVAISALAGMAFMCAGSQPNRGPYGKVLLDILKNVLAKSDHRGFLNTRAMQHGPMYGHGFATLFLAEVSGMVHDPVLRGELDTKLRAAIKLILEAQKKNKEGAWRYTPESHDADLSVTICQIMALRSARNAGIDVPKSAVDKCTDYVKACQDRREGYFRYTRSGPSHGGHFARTAAGVCALNAAGIYKGDEIKAGLDYMQRHRPGVGGFPRADMHYFYGHYYAVQAMWTAGGSYWSDWYPSIRDELISRQNADGSWADAICYHYGTAMACIILQVPNNYLPILQK